MLDEYGKRTLEFVGNVASAATRDEIIALTMKELAWYGLTFVSSWSVYPGASLEECADLNNRPADYLEHYLRNDLVWRDPVLVALRQTHRTLSWNDVRKNFRLTKAERHLVDEGRDFGATDGLVLPVFTKDGPAGVFSPCGWKPDLSPGARAALELVGLYAHQALQRTEMLERRRAEHVPLTSREREIMRWVAVGKTNDEIASILTIATATVKTLLARAQSKLDATSRTYAVVQALRTGELDLCF